MQVEKIIFRVIGSPRALIGTQIASERAVNSPDCFTVKPRDVAISLSHFGIGADFLLVGILRLCAIEGRCDFARGSAGCLCNRPCRKVAASQHIGPAGTVDVDVLPFPVTDTRRSAVDFEYDAQRVALQSKTDDIEAASIVLVADYRGIPAVIAKRCGHQC